MRRRLPREEDVRIRYLDRHLVVVEKPAGMTTLRHPEERNWPKRRKQLQPTLDEMLPRVIEKKERSARRPAKPARGSKSHAKKRIEVRPGPTRHLRAVHRIDRETSGLMIFARTVDSGAPAGDAVRDHSLHRVYLAVALGDVAEQTFESPASFLSRGDGRRGSTPNSKLGKRAVTHVKPIERLKGYTVVECQLETGRTHQIRIHLSEAGHPLCGDEVYHGSFPGKPIPDESGEVRLALHAAEIGFEHPITHEQLKFVMPLPADMTTLIDRLRGRSCSCAFRRCRPAELQTDITSPNAYMSIDFPTRNGVFWIDCPATFQARCL